MKSTFLVMKKKYLNPKTSLWFSFVWLFTIPFFGLAFVFPSSRSQLMEEHDLVIEAEADAYVRYDFGTSVSTINYGSEEVLLVQYTTGVDYEVYRKTSYVRFRIPKHALPAHAMVTSITAQLYLDVSDYKVFRLRVREADNNWDESSITYDHQPAQFDSPFAISEEIDGYIRISTSDRWIDIARILYAPGYWGEDTESLFTYSIDMYPGYYATEGFSSREGNHPPRIIIRYFLLPTETPTETSTVTPSPMFTASTTPSKTITVTPSKSPTKTPAWTDTPVPKINTPTVSSTPVIIIRDGKLTNTLVLLVGGATLLGLVSYIGFSYFRISGHPPGSPSPPGPDSPPDGPPNKPDHPSILPVIPPPRLLRFWLTQPGVGSEQAISDHVPLVENRTYNLNVQIQVRALETAAKPPIPGTTYVDVVLFSPQKEIEIARCKAQLAMGATGNSTIVNLPIKPLKSGKLRVRLCVYYRNVLLQSAVMEVKVDPPGKVGQRSAKPIHSRVLDYVASPDLHDLAAFTQPSLSIFTNDASDGSHWIGVYSTLLRANQDGDFQKLFVFSDADLSHLAKSMREKLYEAQGGESGYRPQYPLPLNQKSIQFIEQILLDLAVEGFRDFNAIFLNDPAGIGMKNLEKFNRALEEHGLITIARCRGHNVAIPWAALYSYYVAVDAPNELHLCEFFKASLMKNQWSGPNVLSPLHDQLDLPGTCLARPDCPVARDPKQKKFPDGKTVCPFGFWGFSHPIEQPLQQVSPTSVDAVPENLKTQHYVQEHTILWNSQQKLRCVVGIHPDFLKFDEAASRIKTIFNESSLELEFWDKSPDILRAILEGGRHIYYFFCHGTIDNNTFKLEFSPNPISSAGLYPFNTHWPQQPKPLFILNGCETAAINPEIVHGFLEKLRLLGASGVVGTEIQVSTALARPVGSLLTYYLLSGYSIGEAFLSIRRHLLRQGNPLGLVYTYYAPADLHLHRSGNCEWCKKHQKALSHQTKEAQYVH